MTKQTESDRAELSDTPEIITARILASMQRAEENLQAAHAELLPGAPPADIPIKADEGKLQYDLIPARAFEEVVAVMTFGAKKYAADNWRAGTGFGFRRCFGALCRHAWAWFRGQDLDAETGIHHLAAVAFYCLILMDYHFTNHGVDDRRKH